MAVVFRSTTQVYHSGFSRDAILTTSALAAFLTGLEIVSGETRPFSASEVTLLRLGSEADAQRSLTRTIMVRSKAKRGATVELVARGGSEAGSAFLDYPSR